LKTKLTAALACSAYAFVFTFGVLKLIDRTHLGGVGGELQLLNLQAGGVFTAPAVWQDPQADQNGDSAWLFVSTGSATFGLRAVTNASGQTRLQQQWRVSYGATSPIVAGGDVWTIQTGGELVALSAATGAESFRAPLAVAGSFPSPAAAGAMLYAPDDDRVAAFAGV